jgi:hypothetical protein
MPRDLFIIARHEPELYSYLKNKFAGRPDIGVILDRRVGERRRRSEPNGQERRRVDRRTRSTVDEDIEALGFAILSYR